MTWNDKLPRELSSRGTKPVRMPEMTSKVKFFETSSGSLHEGDGQSSGYPVPLNRKKKKRKSFEMFETH